jgi:hypothetical protein
VLVATTVLAIALAAPPRVMAQTPSSGANDEREQAFVESLRREDATVADRYVALRDARGKAIAELERAETQYRAAGVELRSAFLPQLRQARRNFAATSLALLDFFDWRDRQAVSRYQEEIVRINGILVERARTRAEYERLLTE